MLDLVVTGGTAVLPSGAQTADIGVAGGRITAIGAPGSLQSVGAARIIDASGQIVIPGGIVHNARNSGSQPVRAIGVYLVEKGKPLGRRAT